ncbi:MAG TPA: PAS domain-containing sensor histidine kinase [Bacteriovoracaceae bacterium]|nr:PAS domain-containing sensor histidine kinase [Bacteriovoracaceae bacterium]
MFGKTLEPITVKETLQKAQQARYKAESRFKLLIESMQDYAFFMLDLDGNIEIWNSGAENVHGYTSQEVIGTSLSKIYTQEDQNKNLPQRHIDLATKFSRFEEELWMARKDGRRFWARFVITSFRDESNELSSFAIMVQDLSKYKETENKLLQNERIARKIFEGIKDYAICTLDLEGRITSWNEGARRIKGYETNEVLGCHFSLFYLPEEIAIGKCAYEIEETIKTGRYEEEGWRLRKDGTSFWAHVVLSAIRNDANEVIGFTKVSRDMTDRKRAEDLLRLSFVDLEKKIDKRTNELVATNFKLQEAVKIRDEFLSIASHELKTPLTPLKLQTQIVSKKIIDGTFQKLGKDKLLKIMNVLETSVDRLSSLVENLLDVSRISRDEIEIRKQKLNLKTVFEELFDRYRSTIELSKTGVTLEIPCDVIGYFDLLRIEQVFLNLLTNALKYGEQRPVRVSLTLEDGKACLIFKDQGTGISEKHKEKIFERYEKIEDHRNVSGLGLGLYITKEIIVSHGGSITVESQLGKGSTFKVLLPL